MFFKLLSLVMVSICVLFAVHVEPEHAIAAVLIPGAAAIGIALLSSA